MHRFFLASVVAIAMFLTAGLAQAENAESAPVDILTLMPDHASAAVTQSTALDTDDFLADLDAADRALELSIVLGLFEVPQAESTDVTFANPWVDPTKESTTSRPYSSIFDPRHVVVCLNCDPQKTVISMLSQPTAALPASITTSRLVIAPSEFDVSGTLVAELRN